MDMRQLRERQNLRTVDVASQLGVSESTIRNWEHGRSVPRFEVISGLMRIYQCTFMELEEAMNESLSQSQQDVSHDT